MLLGLQFGGTGAGAGPDAPGRPTSLRRLQLLGCQGAGPARCRRAVRCGGDTPPGIRRPRITWAASPTPRAPPAGPRASIVCTQARRCGCQEPLPGHGYGLSVDDAMLHVGPADACRRRLPVSVLPARRALAWCSTASTRPRCWYGGSPHHHLILVPTTWRGWSTRSRWGLVGDWSSCGASTTARRPRRWPDPKRAQRVFRPILPASNTARPAVQPLCVVLPARARSDSADGADEPIGSCGGPRPTCAVALRSPMARRCQPAQWARSRWRTGASARNALLASADLEAETLRNGWFHRRPAGPLRRQNFLHIVGGSRT